jgi:pyrimidine deaminase RibD-like protein
MARTELDRSSMELAVALSRKSVSEDDGRIHPYVGAVVAHPNGEQISTGYRGQYRPGNHAEQEAIHGIDPSVVSGSTVYSTLEPCTFRGNQTPCCLRLIDRGVAEVVIGILDPNPDIRGQGWWKFEEMGIEVRNFDADLVQQIRLLNQDFIDHQLGPGLMITAIQTEGGDAIEVTEHHRAKRQSLKVGTGKVTIRGTYRVRPMPGERITLFVRRDRQYYPQAPIDFSFDKGNSLWQAPSAWINAGAAPVDNEIVIARLSEDLSIAIHNYAKVHDVIFAEYKTDRWIGIELDHEPPGFERLTSLTISAVKGTV